MVAENAVLLAVLSALVLAGDNNGESNAVDIYNICGAWW
jgi:hypothetical protein